MIHDVIKKDRDPYVFKIYGETCHVIFDNVTWSWRMILASLHIMYCEIGFHMWTYYIHVLFDIFLILIGLKSFLSKNGVFSVYL